MGKGKRQRTKRRQTIEERQTNVETVTTKACQPIEERERERRLKEVDETQTTTRRQMAED